MLIVAVVTLCCSTVLLIGYRAERVLSAKWNAERALHASVAIATEKDQFRRLLVEERRVAVQEREITLREHDAEQRTKLPGKTPPMPSDLHARIMSWDDEFAQDGERTTILAAFAELQDWDEVRKVLPPLTPMMNNDVIAAPREGLVQ